MSLSTSNVSFSQSNERWERRCDCCYLIANTTSRIFFITQGAMTAYIGYQITSLDKFPEDFFLSEVSPQTAGYSMILGGVFQCVVVAATSIQDLKTAVYKSLDNIVSSIFKRALERN